MKKFKIPVSWEMYGYIEVEANSVEEAIEIFDQKEQSAYPYGLPDGCYVDASFERELDTDYIIEINSPDN